jgi:MYXO-CTERM domain-containing protein
MKLEQSFEVSAPIERVWKALIDVEHVAPCLPGAAVTGRNDDGTYNGTFTIKIGPTTAAYTGKLEMRDIDEGEHAATMQAQGNDRRGQGGANAKIVSKLSQVQPGVTRVEVDTDYHITGRLARFGRGGMIEDISERLLREFADRLQASLAAEPEAETAAAGDAETEPVAAAAGEAETEPATAGAGEAETEPATAAVGGAETDRATETEATTPPPPPPKPATPPPPQPPGPGTLAPEPSEPIEGISLIGSVLWQRAKRNPSPIVLAVAVLLALAFWRRRRR